jgi:hypothetical protein
MPSFPAEAQRQIALRTNPHNASYRIDELGVTGSSPVPPIEKALLKGFLVLRYSTAGKVGPLGASIDPYEPVDVLT